MDEVIENIPQESGKWREIFKRILKLLWIIIYLGLIRFFVFYLCSFFDIDTWKMILISFFIVVFLLMSIIFVIVSSKSNKLRRRIKWALIVLWYIIGFFWSWFIFLWFVSNFIFKRVTLQTELMFIIIWTIVYILLILFVLLFISWYKSKNNKIIKWIIIIGIINLIIIRWWLTRWWVIPNWLWIEALCSCVDCNWTSFSIRQFAQINWKECCEWTYNRIQQDLPPSYGYNPNVAAKPIIYLYPAEETEVNVTLWAPENLSHTYPKYNPNNWRNVVAQPNGDLEDIDTWRKLYALYREWKTYTEDHFEEWFVVKWEDTIPFLEEKLALLWLNEREAEEFIVYRLPQMENNKYNLIRFETKQEQDENMPLNITPTPDTVIRVMMDWKAIEELIDIPEQELVTPKRNWFTVVEWWGSPRN